MITTYALAFGTIALILIVGILGFIRFEIKRGKEREVWSQSLQIAEAGLNYYYWCVNNDVEEGCTGERNYYDLKGNSLGNFFLEDESTSFCGEVVKKEVISSGRTNSFPEKERRLKASFGRVSVAKYSYLLNDNVWAGSDREIRGFYHSNGGIRMDGENQSLVTSAKETWLCSNSFGCNYQNCPSSCTREGSACRCPGVLTTTGNADVNLFSFPASFFDFDGITIDLAKVKSFTEPYPLEKYWPPSRDINPSAEGYHIKLKETGGAEIWIITHLSSDWAYNEEEGWHYDSFSISDEYLYNTVDVDPSCPLIFVEDNLWIEGKVAGKMTIVSADLLPSGSETTTILVDDIEYASDGSCGLGLVSQGSILISPDSPDTMEIRGVFVAQKGHFGRNLYWGDIKDNLEVYGSIVSNGRVGTKWSSGSVIVSGYLKRENYIDAQLIYDPPCFIPSISSDYKIFKWEEID